MDNFYAYIPLILKYIVILPYFLKDSKQVLRWQNTQLNSKLKNNKYIIDNLSLGTIDIWMYFNGYVLSLAYSFAPTYAVIEGDNNNVWS
ncbi:hypothetical protein [Spiroplasma ixodetis]|uniref:Uncharacterized protein n=1 Tax=Spiroplasma ixodetis TaxID=2141 RepID=A0ABN6T1Q6_9MOLU|nr:hypothetical protein [Spiroplasma ixodetis]BDT05123.1 hypothetical protein SHM_27690 [Spiroplasma ixodetis]